MNDPTENDTNDIDDAIDDAIEEVGGYPFNKTIKITSDLDIKFQDLMREVDQNHDFTLRDVLRAVISSTEIPVGLFQEILHCSGLETYYKEAESKPFWDEERDLDYLELYVEGSIDDRDGLYGDGSSKKDQYSSQWAFHGRGKLGVVYDEENFPMEPEAKSTFRQPYAVEFSAMHELADYKIKVFDKISITDWREGEIKEKILDYKLSISLIELLYAVFWELSFCGGPEGERDEMIEMVNDRMERYNEAKKNGTINKVTKPWKEIKNNIIAKLENAGNTENDENTESGETEKSS